MDDPRGAKVWQHILHLGREFLTHWAAAGLIIALTGLAPEHWLADLFSHLAIPDIFWRGWVGGADIRVALVGVGVAIIAWDVARRSRQEKSSKGSSATNEAVRRTAIEKTEKASIAVLPFQNMSGDPVQEYFADGVTESLTTDLSRIVGLFVIARNTAFTYKGKPNDVKQIGRELNVRYVLEGSVQRGGT